MPTFDPDDFFRKLVARRLRIAMLDRYPRNLDRKAFCVMEKKLNKVYKILEVVSL